MGRVIFNRDKYEEYMINKMGHSEFLLMKLNSGPSDAWPETLDGRDITDIMFPIFENGQEVFSVMWKEEVFYSGRHTMNCFIKPVWCDIVED